MLIRPMVIRGLMIALVLECGVLHAAAPGSADILQRAAEIRRQLDEFYATQKAEAEKIYDSKEPFGGAVLVAVGDEVIYSRGLGLANREWNIPATTDTKFEIWSVTKTFTAVAVLQLQERGKLRIDEPMCSYLTQYLEACPANWKTITVRQLLSHTSGLLDLNKDESAGLGFFSGQSFDCNRCRMKTTPQEVMAIHRNKPLGSEPGTHFAYSNFGYYLLGLIVEQAAGKSYEDALREQIFAPLGMKDTGLNDPRKVLAKRAGKYAADQDELNRFYDSMESASIPGGPPRKLSLFNGEYQDPSWIFSAGALYSTAEDFFKYGRALARGKLVSPQTLRQMWTAVAVPYFMLPDADKADAARLKDARSDYGLGWHTKPVAGRRCYHHAGAGMSTGAILTVCPDAGLIVAELGYMTTNGPPIVSIVLGNGSAKLRE